MKRFYPKEFRTPKKMNQTESILSKKNSVNNPQQLQFNLTKSTTFANQSLNIKCTQHGHQQNEILYVCLQRKCDQESRLCCSKCIKGCHSQHANQMAKVSDFLKSELVDDLVFKIENWPGDDQLSSIKSFLLQEESYISGLRQSIENYFTDLQEKVTQQIEKIKGRYIQEVATFYTRGAGKDKAEFIKLLKQYFMNVYDVKDIQKNIREYVNREIVHDAFQTRLEFQLTNKETLEKSENILKFFNNKQFQNIKNIKVNLDERSFGEVHSFIMEGLKRLNKSSAAINIDNKKDAQLKMLPYSQEGSTEQNLQLHDMMNYLISKYKDISNKELLQYKQEIYADGSKYEGFLLNGQRHLLGVRYYCDGNTYCGEYENGQRHGYGIFYYQKGGIFEGEWQNDKRNGFGKETYQNGSKFEGMYVNDLKNGRGKYKFPDGKIYDGEYSNDKRHGKGEIINQNNVKQVVIYENGLKKSEQE